MARTPADGDEVRFSREDTGKRGAILAADTAAHDITAGGGLAATEAAWTSIYILTNAAFTTLTPTADSPLAGTWTGVTFPAGATIKGSFTTFTLASGSCIAYRGTRN